MVSRLIAKSRSLLLRRYCSTVAKYEYWNREQHEAWQLRRLRKLVLQAERHVPYYRRRFREAGFAARDFLDLRDLQRIPFVTKEDIFTNGAEAFCDERIPSILRFRNSTGGSSGTPCPLVAFRPFSAVQERAFMLHQWYRAGYKDGDPIAILRRPIVFDHTRVYEYKDDEKVLTLSTYDLNGERLREYVEAISSLRINFLHVYPSSLMLFIDHLKRLPHRVRFPHLRGVLAGSEGLSSFQKEACEEVLGVPCYHWYGHAEMTLMGGWCEHTEKFHFFPQLHFSHRKPDPRSPVR